MVTSQELSSKKVLLRSLLRCPHRELSDTIGTFSTALESDPLFSGKCFYALTLEEFNRIRDLSEAGIAFLLTSPHAVHREAGRVCFQTLEPYRAARVGKFVRESLKTNRQVKGAIVDYLQTLEGNKNRFMGAAKVARRSLHWLYETYYVPHGELAQAVIFKGEVPPGEADPIELLNSASTPEEQARIIVEYRIPFRQATSVLKGMSPAVWVALIEVMTPNEALISRAAVERSGVLSDPEIRKLYENKLTKIDTDKGASVSTISERKSTKGKDERIDKILKLARQEKVSTGAKIDLDTMIAIDCSSSLGVSIEVSKKLCPHIAAMKGKESELKIYGFNETAWPIKYTEGSLEEFEQIFSLMRANGMTSLGAALKRCVTDGLRPEQIIYVTDQGENTKPSLASVIEKEGLDDARFIFVNVGVACDLLSDELERNGHDVIVFNLTDTNVTSKGWYSVLDNLNPFLTKGGFTQIVEQIMALELPRRKKTGK
jgi:hypothetical protein